MDRQEINLPLYDFFDALRKNNYSLGIPEYYTFLEALRLEYCNCIDKKNGQLDKEKTLKVCRVLWLKPNQSRFAFEQLFEEHFALSEKNKQSVLTNDKDEDSVLEITNEIVEEVPQSQTINSDKSQRNIPDDQDDDKPARASQIKEDSPLVKFVLGNPYGAPMKVSDKIKDKDKKFFFSDYYFDITKRQMQQACRFLPLKQDSNSSEEIDIHASVEQYARDGFLVQPVFLSRERIINQVLLLIDYGGSMLAFDTLVDTFSEALQDAFKVSQGESKYHLKSYYFHNVPSEYCYTNKSFTTYQKTENILQNLHPKRTSIIIVSDAGAARGGNSDRRFKSTLRFLLQIKKKTSHIVWLNPIPEYRWEKTTAQRIRRFVKMYGMDSQRNLQKAVNVLRGK